MISAPSVDRLEDVHHLSRTSPHLQTFWDHFSLSTPWTNTFFWIFKKCIGLVKVHVFAISKRKPNIASTQLVNLELRKL